MWSSSVCSNTCSIPTAGKETLVYMLPCHDSQSGKRGLCLPRPWVLWTGWVWILEKRNGPRATQKILYLWIFLRLHGQKHTDISVTQTKAKWLSSCTSGGYLWGGGGEGGKPARVRGQLEKSLGIKSLQRQHLTTEEAGCLMERRTRENGRILGKQWAPLPHSPSECQEMIRRSRMKQITRIAPLLLRVSWG